jgi:hypothetical protein
LPTTGRAGHCQTTGFLDAPFQNREASLPGEIEVTDPTHPLFGRRFAVASVGRVPRTDGFVLVIYHDKMLLRIPVPATNLWPVRRKVPTKLTPEAMVELIARAGESEDACASTRATSGDSLAPLSAAPSRTTSPERSGR